MKKITSLLLLFIILFTACEGDQGPPGFDGVDGGILVSNAFEIELDFTNENDYQVTEPFGFEVFPTDVALVYIQDDVINGESAWKPLPQTFQLNDGDLIYNYAFSQSNVRFFLDGTTNFTTLDPIFTDAQIFRVVVVPADNVGRLDITNLNAVMDYYSITQFPQR